LQAVARVGSVLHGLMTACCSVAAMKQDTDDELKQVFANARHLAGQVHPGCVLPLEIDYDRNLISDGFGLSTGTGCALLYGGPPVELEDQGILARTEYEWWAVRCYAAVALNVPYNPEVFDWVNDQNVDNDIGQYFCYADNGEIGVIWKTTVWHKFLIGEPSKDVARWFRRIIHTMLEVSSTESVSFVENFAGRIVPPTPAGLEELFFF
jgi:hypothetical protein